MLGMSGRLIGHALLVATLATALAACGHARIFSQDGNGGVVSLHGDEGSAMDDAVEVMSGHCGPRGYAIVARDSVIVGTESYVSTATDYDEREDRATDGHAHHGYGHSSHAADERRRTSGNVQTDTVSGTRQVYETRITYRCGQ